MNLRLVKIIYKKEMLDTLRDRRTLLSMIVIPLVIFPVLMFGLSSLVAVKLQGTKRETQKVTLMREGHAPRFVSELKAGNIFEVVKESNPILAIKEKRIALALEFSEDFEARIAREDSVQIVAYLDEAEFRSNIALEKFKDLLSIYQDSIINSRLSSHQLGKTMLRPISLLCENVASKEKMGGFVLSMFLPYMIILLSFTGAMYPAIDLTAGEKERGTMETILSSPASHFEITAGKFLTVLTASVITAILATASMGATFILGFSRMGNVSQDMQVGVQPLSILLLLVMILPVACLFSSLLLSLALFAKSFKEAQNYINSLMIVIILPAMVSLIPGFELKTGTAFIPVVSISLASKDILMGDIRWGQIGLIFFSSVAYALLSLFVTKRLFDKEEVLFRI